MRIQSKVRLFGAFTLLCVNTCMLHAKFQCLPLLGTTPDQRGASYNLCAAPRLYLPLEDLSNPQSSNTCGPTGFGREAVVLNHLPGGSPM